MLEMRAIVMQLRGKDASVQPIGTGGCGHCDSEGGCGSSTLTKVFCNNKPRIFYVRNEVNAKVGDEVQISIPDGVLLRGAMKMYVLPLILLLVGGIAYLLPNLLFVVRLSAAAAAGRANAASFFVGELIKVAATVAILVGAQSIIPDLQWIALLVGLFVALKANLLAFLLKI